MKIQNTQIDALIASDEETLVMFIIDFVRLRTRVLQATPSREEVLKILIQARKCGLRSAVEIAAFVAVAIREDAEFEDRSMLASASFRRAKKAVRARLCQPCAEYALDFFELALPVILADVNDDEEGEIYPPRNSTITLTSKGGYAHSFHTSRGIRTSDRYCSFRFYIEEARREDRFTATMTWEDGMSVLFKNSRVFSFIDHANKEDLYEAVVGSEPHIIARREIEYSDSVAPIEPDPRVGPLSLDHRSLFFSNIPRADR